MEEGSEPTYVRLPLEHPGQTRGQCGLLLKHMYSTRAAVDGWLAAGLLRIYEEYRVYPRNSESLHICS